jgi:branched-chain amino acid transport system substrate-binding protein
MNKFYRVIALLVLFSLLPISVFASDAEPNQPTSKADCKNGGWRNYPHIGFSNQGQCLNFVKKGNFVCEDALGCVSYPEGEPVHLASALALSGPLSWLGIDELRGIEIALVDHGTVFGRNVALRNEDSDCSPAGGAAAAQTIVSDPSIMAVVGTSCSSAASEAAPIISAAGYSMVSPSNTAPYLTDPAAPIPGYYRTAWNDRDQAAAMAEYAFGAGATSSAVIVSDGDAYSESLGEAFVDTFVELGGFNLAFERAAPDGSDASAAISAVVAAGVPDVLYFPVFAELGVPLVIEARAEPSLGGTTLAATDSMLEVVDLLPTESEGMLFTNPDASFMDSPAYADFAATYFAAYGQDPNTPFSAYAYDAADVILAGIEAVGVVDANDTLHIGRQALRDALYATSNFDGLTGTITCDPFGDCATTDFVVLIAVAGELVPAP